MSALVVPAQNTAVASGPPTGAHPGAASDKQGGAGERSEFASLLRELTEKKDPSTLSNGAQDGVANAETTNVDPLKTGASNGSDTDLDGLFYGALASRSGASADEEVSRDDAPATPSKKTKQSSDAAATLAGTPLQGLGLGMQLPGVLPGLDQNITRSGDTTTTASAVAAQNDATAAISAAIGQTIAASTGVDSAALAMRSDAATTASVAPPVVEVQVLGARTYLGLEGVVKRASKTGSTYSTTDSADRATQTASATSSTAEEPMIAAASPAPPPAGGTGAEHREQSGQSSAANSSNERNEASGDAGVPSNASAIGLSGFGGAISYGATPLAIDDLPDAIAGQASTLAASAGANSSAGGATIGASAVRELDVQLNPADLGALSIKMRLAGGNLAVVIEVSKSDTLKLIESKRDEISDRLATVDHSVASIVVKASDNNNSYGENANGTDSGTASQGDAQSGAANSSQGRARSSRDDGGGAQALQTDLPEDLAPRRGGLNGLFV